MRTKFKKALSVLLTAVMLLSMAPLAEIAGIDFGRLFSLKAEALETTGQCGDNVYWSFDSGTGTLTISGTGNMYDYYSGPSPFKNNSSIKSVVIEDGVTSIGNVIFDMCTNITHVEIPDSVRNIGLCAFNNCNKLSSIIIPASVTSCGYNAFIGCDSLTSITVDDDNPVYDSRNNCNAIIETDTNKLISGCKSTVIPNSVTGIGKYAFAHCNSLTNIIIPRSVISIELYAFFNCDNLKNITIPDSVTSVGICAFFSCDSLSDLIIPSNIISIGENAFDGCSNLTNIIVDNNNSVYDSRENCNAIIETDTNRLISGCKNTIIPSSVISIGSRAFADCSGLTYITIPDSITNIGIWAFSGCSALKNVYYTGTKEQWQEITIDENNSPLLNATIHFEEDSTESVDPITGQCGDSLIWSLSPITSTLTISGTGDMWDWDDPRSAPWYSYRNSIEEVNIDNQVTSIGKHAFYGYYSLTIGNISDSVTDIGDFAFGFCDNLTGIIIPNSVTRVGDFAFAGCEALTGIIIPDSVTSIGGLAFWNCSGLTSITIPGSVTSIGEGAFYDCIGLANVEIGNGVSSIYNSAFSGCISLSNVIIPSSVTFIDDCAFPLNSLINIIVDEKNLVYDSRNNCNAIIETKTNKLIAGCRNAVIPDTVTAIGDSAFWNCSGLTSITIPGSVTSIGEGAFYKCSGLTSITIPDSIISIGYVVFKECSNLIDITIPDSVTDIGYGAFDFCDALSDVYYGGTEEQWQAITVGGANKYLLNANIHFTVFIETTLNPNGGSMTTPGSVLTAKGKSFVLPTPVRSGYTCLGWARSSSASVPEYRCGENFTSDSDAELYAVWTEYGGKCGDNLTWTLDGHTGLFTISGTGNMWDYDKNGLPFEDRYLIKYVIIEDGVTGIGANAFAGFLNLTCVTIPDSVKTIGGKAFDGCGSLVSITMGSGIADMGSSAFGRCNALADIYYHGTAQGWKKIKGVGDTSCLSKAAVHYSGNTGSPSIAIPYVTNDVTSSQTVILTIWDNNSVDGYYWGTDSDFAKNTYYSASGASDVSAALTVSSAGTYYLTAKDSDGNDSSENVTFYMTTLKADEGESFHLNGVPVRNASAYVLTRSGNSFIPPTAVKGEGDYSVFSGWATDSSSVGRKKLTPDSSRTYHPVWMSNSTPYTFRKDTYSFSNYDVDSQKGHCFGMSSTSAGYYINSLPMPTVKDKDDYTLYDLELTDKDSKGNKTVKKPICDFEDIQGSYSREAIVAGGSAYIIRRNDVESDWEEILNYVKNGEYNNKGLLQIGYQTNSKVQGHAVNFLYYDKENERIYVYDNNVPNDEVYFYRNNEGKIIRHYRSSSGSSEANTEIENYILLRDMSKYFVLTENCDTSKVLYAKEGAVQIEGALSEFPMECGSDDGGYVMFELPQNAVQIAVTPLADNAEFEYLGETYQFGKVGNGTVGILILPVADESGTVSAPQFEIIQPSLKKVAISGINIKFGGKKALAPKITADTGAEYNIKYICCDTSVAEVDRDGTVYAKNSGEVEIICIVTDIFGNSVSDTCKVTVGDSFIQHVFRVIFSRIFGEKFADRIVNYFINKLQ